MPQFCIVFNVNYTILATQRGGMAQCPPPKYAPGPVYLRLPWLGSVSTRFEKPVKSAVKQCFSAVETRVVVYSTNELLSATSKGVWPLYRKATCVSIRLPLRRQSVCRFFLPKLQNRIKQHISKSIRSFSTSQKRLLPAHRFKSTQTNTRRQQGRIGKGVVFTTTLIE